MVVRIYECVGVHSKYMSFSLLYIPIQKLKAMFNPVFYKLASTVQYLLGRRLYILFADLENAKIHI